MKGRISEKWGHVMTITYLSSPKIDPTQSHRRFQTTLITDLWTLFDTIWKLRNSMLQNPANFTSLYNLELNKRICMYQHCPRFHLSIVDQHLLHQDLPTILHLSIPQKHAWLSVVNTIAQMHRRKNEEIMQTVINIKFYNKLHRNIN